MGHLTHFTIGKHFEVGGMRVGSKPCISAMGTKIRSKPSPKASDTTQKYCSSASEDKGSPRAVAACQQNALKPSNMAEPAMREDSGEEVAIAEAGFVDTLGIVLERWVDQAANMPGEVQKTTRFHSTYVPGICIGEYLKRLQKYFVCSDECFVLALVYIDRISKLNPSLQICALTMHRLLFTAVMTAAKFHDDDFYSNKYYAKVGGMSLKEANLLESIFLRMLGWSVCVSAQEYQLYYALVHQSVYQPALASKFSM